MRTRSRRAPLLAACAFALAASLSAAAGDTKAVSATAVVQPTMPAVSGSLSTPQGERMAAELAGLEKALIQHLKGEQPSTFEALDARRKELKARIDAAGLVPNDKKVLDDRLSRSASVIARSLRLTGGAALLDPEVSKAVANAGAVPNPAGSKDPLYQIDALLGELDRASANPADAEKIFDALNRRYGTPKVASGAVPVNFGAIRKTLADTWSFTPKGAPGTNAAKARDLGRDTPAPAQEPVVARGESVDYAALLSLSGGRAANMIAERLPDGGERRFVADRSDRLKELLDAGRLAVSAMGGDPNTFSSIDALVAHLSRQEQDLADSMSLGNNFDSMDEVMLRVSAIKSINRELGAFMARLWEYRGFLRESLVAAQVPLNTKFTPWETFPDGQGSAGAQVVGLNRGVSQFVGLRYDNPDGSSRFQGQGRGGRSGLIVALDKGNKRAESLIGYDGDGKVQSALTQMYDGSKLTRSERLDMGTGIVEIVDYKADGAVLKSTRKNSKTGEQFVRDLSGQDGRFEATTLDGRREIRFLANANGAPPAISLRVEKVGTDGTFELERLVLQNGTHIVAKSPHVNQLLENGKKNLGWEVALKSLVDATDGRKRLAVGRSLAHETIVALGMNDDNGRLSKPMAPSSRPRPRTPATSSTRPRAPRSDFSSTRTRTTC
ncbi:MAG: hypothetical protein PHS14_12480 [Elusimicrobia bacterium]|nr:hypothetical protein [Elusimicrobiota bacterium]